MTETKIEFYGGLVMLVRTHEYGDIDISFKGGSACNTIDLTKLSSLVEVQASGGMLDRAYAESMADTLKNHGWAVNPPKKIEAHVRLGLTETLIPQGAAQLPMELRKEKLL